MWESPLGLNEALPAGKQLVGNSGSAGPTVTAGGLVFVGATSDRRFRAFDAKTGKEVWVMKLPPGANGNSPNANANPMSYQGKSGKQLRRDRRWHDAGGVRVAVNSQFPTSNSQPLPTSNSQRLSVGSSWELGRWQLGVVGSWELAVGN